MEGAALWRGFLATHWRFGVALAVALLGCSPAPPAAVASSEVVDAEIAEDSPSGILDQMGDAAGSSDGASVVDIAGAEVGPGDAADLETALDSNEVAGGDGEGWDVDVVDGGGAGEVVDAMEVDSADGGVPLPDASTAELCAALEPLCGVGCSSQQDWQANPPILTYKNELSAILGPKNFGLNPFYRSLWVPAQLEPSQPGHVLLRASWFNNVSAKATVSNMPFSQGFCDHCQYTKASLLPSGCVTLDIDVDAGTAKFVSLDVAKPSDFISAKSSFVNEIGCPKVYGAVPTGKPLSVTLADGRKVTAFPGRASVHALQFDPDATISAVVRDIAGATLPAPVTAAVIEVAASLAPTPTAVAVDVSVCHATPAHIQASGCACPKSELPTTVPAGPSMFWMTAVSDALDVTITNAFLDATEPPYWSGVGLLAGPYEGLASQVCCKNCTISDPKRLCGGWGETTQALPVVVYAGTGATRWSGCGADLSISDIPSPIGKATPFTVDLDFGPNGSSSTGTFVVWTQLTAKSLPPEQRDNAWTSLFVKTGFGPLTYNVTEWGPNTVTLNLTTDKALACRKLASNTQAIGLNGKIDNLCKWTTATFTVHVDVKKPGTPQP